MYSEIQRVVNTSSEEMMAKYQVSQVLSHLRGLTVCRERKLVVSGSYSILNESLEILFFYQRWHALTVGVVDFQIFTDKKSAVSYGNYKLNFSIVFSRFSRISVLKVRI